MTETVLIGIDWGTSSARAYAFGAQGEILATVSDRSERPLGVQTLKLHLGREPTADDFGAALDDLLQALWRNLELDFAASPQLECPHLEVPISKIPIIACGMIGSRQGLKDAGYATCPTNPTTLAKQLVDATCGPYQLRIVPGVRMPKVADSMPDFMRGEETQVLGALLDPSTVSSFVQSKDRPKPSQANPGQAKSGQTKLGQTKPDLFVLPGSHSKWVDVAQGTITQFQTHFTGELFAVLKEHSILGRLFTQPGQHDTSPEARSAQTKAFELGIHTARQHPNMLQQHLFGTRALGLDGRLAPSSGESFLSGLLIGHEICAALATRGEVREVKLIGSHELCEHYALALGQFGLSSEMLSNTAAMGLWRLYLAD